MPKKPLKGDTPPIDPLIRWAGSKRQILATLAQAIPADFDRYLEPFAGSACLFFAIRPKCAILGDINTELIRAYREVKYRPDDLASVLRPMRRSRREFLRLRAVDPRIMNGSSRAARFLYLNRFCFNGLYRTNLAGAFNVPYGKKGSGRLPTIEILRKYTAALRGARLINGDFEEVLAFARKGDFVYMDPPFAQNATRIFREYHPDSFLEEDLKRLRKWLLALDRKGVSFLVSYADCDEARTLAAGFRIRRLSVRRNIAGFTDRRTRSTELLISNVKPCRP